MQEEPSRDTRRNSGAGKDEAGPRPRRGEVAEEFVRRVADEVERRLTEPAASVEQKVQGARETFKLHYKIIYGTLVFLGVVLVWFGIWTRTAAAPVLSNPVISLAAGVLLLTVTGSFFKSLFGVYLPND